MRKNILIILIFIFNAGLVTPQMKTGEWRDHFSYSSLNFVNVRGDKIIAANTLGIFFYVKNENSYYRLNKTNGLSDIDICSMITISDGKIIIGYENGNIDIVEGDKVIPIPDLKNKNMVGSKRINSFFEYEGKVFCSMPFGIMVVDPYKYEIADTYYIGPEGADINVNRISVFDGYIYAATEKGLFRAPADSPALGSFLTWEEITGMEENFSDLINYGNYLVVAKGESDARNEIYTFQSNSLNLLKTVDGFRGFTTDDNLLGIYTREWMELLDKDFEVYKKIDSYSFEREGDVVPSIASAVIDDNSGEIIIADENYGIVKINEKSVDKYFYPDGPMSNTVFDLNASSVALYVTAGATSSTWNNTFTPGEYSYYDGIKWTNFRKNDTIQEQEYWRDFLRIAIDPKEPSKAYICTWGVGVFEVDEGNLINHYDQYNSGLQNIEWTGKDYYVRVGGIAVDDRQNVWMNNAEVNNGLVLKTYDGNWIQYTYKALHKLHSMGEILITRTGYYWMIIPRTNMAGLFVFDINNTIDNQNDDRYRCALSPALDSDPRNAGLLKIWDENGEEITDRVYSLAEDKNGYVWIGTNKGVMVYYRPYAVFDEEKPVATRIKVPRNDGSNLADYLLEKETVTAIAVDGGNRKWLGTENSGLFLVSEDGTKTIHSFNTDNSPLISNSINAVSINPKTGEVFIGTAKGIVSYKGLATEGEETFGKVYAYPNPVRENYTGNIIITGLMENSVVKIVNVSGNLVYETTSVGGQAEWNGKNLHGEKVKTGVYIVFVSNEDGSEKSSTKILIVN